MANNLRPGDRVSMSDGRNVRMGTVRNFPTEEGSPFDSQPTFSLTVVLVEFDGAGTETVPIRRLRKEGK